METIKITMPIKPLQRMNQWNHDSFWAASVPAAFLGHRDRGEIDQYQDRDEDDQAPCEPTVPHTPNKTHYDSPL